MFHTLTHCPYCWPHKDGVNGQTYQGGPRTFANREGLPDLPHPILVQQPIRQSRDYQQKEGCILPPPNTSLALRIPSLPQLFD